ncbi:pyridoxal phosphate-dependent decarboxylase family protein [Chryseobacterium sp. A321]
MDLEQISAELDKLRISSDQLEPNESQRQESFREIESYSEFFLSSLEKGKGYQKKEIGNLQITGERKNLSELLKTYHREVAQTGINAASPKHLGYIPGGGLFSAALADFIAAITNPYASVYYASPGAATLENEVIEWLKTVFSFPKHAVGTLCSGGSISTLVAFTAARDHHKIKNERIPKSVVYLSSQVHHSSQKALRILGLEDAILRFVPLDSEHRMIPSKLNEILHADLEKGLSPFLIVATAGTTDTGTIDPLNELADIAQQNHLWFHVDAAYGGMFILSSQKEKFSGIERADSLIVDPHKGLFLPYGVGAVLVKEAKDVLHSHYYTANYMQDGQQMELLQSPANLSPELTKHFRGLRVWLPLQLHGLEPFVSCLEEKLLLTKYFRKKLESLGFCLGPEPDLSVSYFWFPFESKSEEKNRRLLEEIHRDGRVFLSSTQIASKFVIRMAILSFRTKKETIDLAVQMIEENLQKVLEKES